MTVPLWNKLRECLFISQEQREKKWNQKRYTMTAKSIQYDGNEEHRFNGIVRWLSERSSNKVSENGTVKVTASSTSSNYHLPKFGNLGRWTKIFQRNFIILLFCEKIKNAKKIEIILLVLEDGPVYFREIFKHFIFCIGQAFMHSLYYTTVLPVYIMPSMRN